MYCLGKHVGHNTKSCPGFNPCSCCQGQHHPAICPKWFPSEREQRGTSPTAINGFHNAAKETPLTRQVVAEMQKDFLQPVVPHKKAENDGLLTKVQELDRRLVVANTQRAAWKTLYERERKDLEEFKCLLQRAMESSHCQNCHYYKKLLSGVTSSTEKVNAEMDEMITHAQNLFKVSRGMVDKHKLLVALSTGKDSNTNGAENANQATISEEASNTIIQADRTHKENTTDSGSGSILNDAADH